MHRYFGVMFIAPLILAMAVAACGGDDDPTPTATAPADVSPTATSPAGPGSLAVASPIENFVLEDLVIQMGTTVTWTNLDIAPHTTTSGVPGGVTDVWDSGTLSRGGDYGFTFTEPGEFVYFCNIHPNMQATVTVTAAP